MIGDGNMTKQYNLGPVKPPCTFDGCGEPQYGYGLCPGHNQQRRRGRALAPIRKRGPVATCSVCADDTPAYVKSSGEPLCRRHHSIWLRHGDARTVTRNDLRPLALGMIREWLSSRDRSECWLDWADRPEWNVYKGDGGGTVTRGYPTLGAGRVMRIVLVESGRPMPPAPGNHGLHGCDNSLCLNPDHLRWGSHKENMADLQAVRNYCKHCTHCNPT